MKKRVISIVCVALALVLIGVVLFFLISKKDDNFDASTVEVNVNLPKDTTASLKVGIMDDASERTTMNAFIEGFNKLYPNIEVTLDIISGDYQQGMLSRVKTQTLPDVFWVGDNNVSYFAEKKLLLNLDAHLDASGFEISDYYESMIKLGQKNQNGSQYMLPRDYNKVVVFYNKALLGQAGIKPGDPLYPVDGWKYETFLELCAVLRSKLDSTVYPVDAMLAWPPVFNSFVRSFGGELMNVEGKPAFNTPEAKQGLDAMKELLDKRYTINPITKTEEIFLAKKAAMWFTVRPMVSSCETANLEYDAVTFPELGTSPRIGAGTSGYGISRRTKLPNEAFAFLNYMISEDGQEAFSKTGNAVPVLKSLQENGTWTVVPQPQQFFNHSAFIKYNERDCLKDYLNNVNVELYSDIDGAMLDLLDRYMGWTYDKPESEADLLAVLDRKVKDINKILNSD